MASSFACFPGLSPIPQRTPRVYDAIDGYERNFLRWIGSGNRQTAFWRSAHLTPRLSSHDMFVSI